MTAAITYPFEADSAQGGGDALISSFVAACAASARVACAAALLHRFIADLAAIAEHAVISAGYRCSCLALAVAAAGLLSVTVHPVVTISI